MIDTVVFDFDGTIMDTNNVIIQSWQHTYRTIRGREGDLGYIMNTFGEPLEDSMRNAFPEVPMEESVAIYRDFHRERFYDMIELFPGVEEMLARLKDEGYKVGLATSRLRVTAYQGLEKYDLFKYFDTVLTVEESVKPKPDPELLLNTLAKMKSEPQTSAMTGDTRLDIACANRAGATSILVGWTEALAGKTKEDFTGDEVPDHIIQTPAEIFEVIR